LHDHHVKLGAKMCPFAGWDMPVQYEGVIQEHQTVRNGVGIFDVSHMGRISVEGEEAEKLIDYLSTNQIIGKSPYSCTYTVWCKEDGGCVDDLIIYKISDKKFFIVVNAGNREKDLTHLKDVAAHFNVTIRDHYETDGILAVQGPKAIELMPTLFPMLSSLKPMRFLEAEFEGSSILIANAGYTGSGGFELYCSNDLIVHLWELILSSGEPLGIKPIGLGARDTLRLEAGFALYGHEISDSIAPTESVSSWTVKWTKQDFLGKKALLELEENSEKRYEHGIVLIDNGIAREGAKVYQNDQEIGRVTSGTHSPTLKKSIAIILIRRNLPLGDTVFVEVRNKKLRAEVVQLPFLKK